MKCQRGCGQLKLVLVASSLFFCISRSSAIARVNCLRIFLKKMLLPFHVRCAALFSIFSARVCIYRARQSHQDSVFYLIETRDGNEYVGTRVSQKQQAIQLRTEKMGTISIPKSEVQKLIPILRSQPNGGRGYGDNPQATRNLFQPNGYALKMKCNTRTSGSF